MKQNISVMILLVFLLSNTFCNEVIPTDTVEDKNDSIVTIDENGLRLIYSKDSTFSMGIVNDGEGPTELPVAALPVHNVSFTYNFWIDSTEITQKHYFDVVGQSPWNKVSSDGQGDNVAAWNISWYDAVFFCNQRSKIDGFDSVYAYSGVSGTAGNGGILNNVQANYHKNGYRLPSEAEWEYSARAGSKEAFPWGDIFNSEFVWMKPFDDSVIYPQEVAKKLVNNFSLYDMSGNVHEWCDNWYYDYSSTDATDPFGPSTGLYKVRRGGSVEYQASMKFQCGNRDLLKLNDTHSYSGFRTVRKNLE